jgi:hypothetical protein
MRRILSNGTRTRLIGTTLLSAGAFGWAGLVLPWRPATPLALLALALALLHAMTTLSAIWWPEGLRRVWRALAWCSLLAAAIFSVALTVTGLDLVATYGALGAGLAALLAVIGLLLLIGTLPIGIWGLRMTGRSHGRP